MTVVSPTSWHVASWTLPSLRTSTLSCPCKGNLPATTWQRCILPASPRAVRRLAPTPVLPSLFSSIQGSFCLRGIPTLCKHSVVLCVSEDHNYTHASINNNFPLFHFLPDATTHFCLLPVSVMMTKYLRCPVSSGTSTPWVVMRRTALWPLLWTASIMTSMGKLKTRQQRPGWVLYCVWIQKMPKISCEFPCRVSGWWIWSSLWVVYQ